MWWLRQNLPSLIMEVVIRTVHKQLYSKVSPELRAAVVNGPLPSNHFALQLLSTTFHKSWQHTNKQEASLWAMDTTTEHKTHKQTHSHTHIYKYIWKCLVLGKQANSEVSAEKQGLCAYTCTWVRMCTDKSHYLLQWLHACLLAVEPQRKTHMSARTQAASD